jgi:hypothetical protein
MTCELERRFFLASLLYQLFGQMQTVAPHLSQAWIGGTGKPFEGLLPPEVVLCARTVDIREVQRGGCNVARIVPGIQGDSSEPRPSNVGWLASERCEVLSSQFATRNEDSIQRAGIPH